MAANKNFSRKTVLALVAALVIGLCFQASAFARGGHGGGHSGSGNRGGVSRSAHSSSRTVSNRSGKVGKGQHGHHRNHRWARSSYNAGYGCNLYYDADEATWYYWCSPDNCYYPVSYCPYGSYTFE